MAHLMPGPIQALEASSFPHLREVEEGVVEEWGLPIPSVEGLVGYPVFE